ncbi:hypothetical protein [Ulvibacter antarcticus]|uniref:Adhesin n=1 Tax=Ulvibacter antarcticus TaxID=442714 RepID=A0A3L9YUI6_9FLAO|nr:hypothetical protein [Ulvibacter antarcticus]RMA64173.1 hypothetical protein BXY75_1041 [Ulvibacter antarcticus]
MKLLYNTCILILLPVLVMANSVKGGDGYSKEKTIKKEFKVNKNALLLVNNSYGNIDIVTWSENRTVIEVRIKTSSDSEEKAQKKLDDITIEFTASSSQVSAKTIFNTSKDSWKIWGNSKSHVSMEVHYTIKLPVTNSVDLDNDYGVVSINRLEGDARIDCDYGQLLIGELMSDNNDLNFDYTNKSTIAYLKNGKINADYSDFTLEKAGNLELTADYTQSEIFEVGNINYNCDYGKVSIGKANDIIGRGDYVTNRIGSVKGGVNLNTDYGSIKIERLMGSAKNVTINAEYTGIKLGFSHDYNFDFYVDLTYAGFSGEDDVIVTKSDKHSSRKDYAGYHGKKNSGNTIRIKSNYGGVTFYKN